MGQALCLLASSWFAYSKVGCWEGTLPVQVSRPLKNTGQKHPGYMNVEWSGMLGAGFFLFLWILPDALGQGLAGR